MGTPMSDLRDVTCHMVSHSVTCHPTQVNASRLTPAIQAGTSMDVHCLSHKLLSWLVNTAAGTNSSNAQLNGRYQDNSGLTSLKYIVNYLTNRPSQRSKLRSITPCVSVITQCVCLCTHTFQRRQHYNYRRTELIRALNNRLNEFKRSMQQLWEGMDWNCRTGQRRTTPHGPYHSGIRKKLLKFRHQNLLEIGHCNRANCGAIKLSTFNFLTFINNV